MEETVFAFDVGKGSLGVAARRGNEILEARSLLIPAEFASITEQRERRRQFRTRLAHKAREKWLKDQCRAAGIEVLEGRFPGDRKNNIPPRKADPRLEREFAEPGDPTVYTSCLLRIMLLRGEKLEGWQVYKALHSAIQRRGYDPKVPWAKKGKEGDHPDDNGTEEGNETTEGEKSDADKEERENQKRINAYEKNLYDIVGGREEFMYPCYHDAAMMGLWDPSSDKFTARQTNDAKRARYDTSDITDTGGAKGFAPRHLVQKELRALIDAAAKNYPTLAGKADFLMYGPAEMQYASFYKKTRDDYKIKAGSEWDWQGALSQKIPRFNNRSVNHCVCIPRFHVCKAEDILSIRTTFLLKLINMRYLDSESRKTQLTAEDIRAIFDEKTKKEKKNLSSTDSAKLYSMNATEWKKWLKKNKSGIPANKGDKIEKPEINGRSSYCRPALRLLVKLITSGESPHAFHDHISSEISNTDTKKGLVREDLAFLRLMPDDWNRIHIPAVQLVDKYCLEGGAIDDAIKQLINKQNSPVIRHRLGLFWKELVSLEKKYGIPDRVVVELVRGDFLGEKKKEKVINEQNRNRRKREVARKKMEDFNWEPSAKNLDKMILLLQQNCQCLFTGELLSFSNPDLLEIEHVVPRGEGYKGPDSNLNTVVTTIDTNRKKRKRTPYEFIQQDKGTADWDAYRNRVIMCKRELGKLKVQILTAEHPEELLEKYTPLAETAWIARLARDIVCLSFGWQPGLEDQEQRIFTVKGRLTANARYKKGLNSLLGTDGKKKNRDDPRHHALDAMVLSFITPNKPLIPTTVTREDFKRWLENKTIFEPAAFKKPTLGETFYAKRKHEGKDVMTLRIPIFEWKKIKPNIPDIRDKCIREQIEKFKDELDSFLKTNPMEKKDIEKYEQQRWIEFVKYLRQSSKGGSRVFKVSITSGTTKEFADLSKEHHWPEIHWNEKGQYKKGKKEHWGQFVCQDKNGKPFVFPVYAFQSIHNERKRRISEGYQNLMFFQTGCKVKLDKDVYVGEKIIPAGEYILSTISEMNQQVSLKNIDPEPAISSLLSAGFHRVK